MSIMTNSFVSRSLRKSLGFTMIEVLVAILVLSVGLLGIAALQLSSLKVNQGAYYRSQASILATDILDRMRANRNAYLAGNYDNLNTGNGVQSEQTCVSAATGCSVAQIALQDFREWQGYFVDVAGVGAGFMPLIPGATGTVTRDGSNNATVTISWVQERWVPESQGTSEEIGYMDKELAQQQLQVIVRI